MDNQHQWNAMLQDMFCRIYRTQYRNPFYNTGVHSGEQSRSEFFPNTTVTNHFPNTTVTNHFPNTTVTNNSANRRFSGPPAPSTVTSPAADPYNNPETSIRTQGTYSTMEPTRMESIPAVPTVTSPPASTMTSPPASTVTSSPDPINRTETAVSGRVPAISMSHDSAHELETIQSISASASPPNSCNKTETVVSGHAPAEGISQDSTNRLETMESVAAAVSGHVLANSTSHKSSNRPETMELGQASTMVSPPDSHNKTETVISDLISHDSANEPKTVESVPASTVMQSTESNNNLIETVVSDRVPAESISHDSSNSLETMGSSLASTVTSPPHLHSKAEMMVSNLDPRVSTSYDSSNEPKTLESNSASTVTSPPCPYNKTETVEPDREVTETTLNDSCDEPKTVESVTASAVTSPANSHSKIETVVLDNAVAESIPKDSSNKPDTMESSPKVNEIKASEEKEAKTPDNSTNDQTSVNLTNEDDKSLLNDDNGKKNDSAKEIPNTPDCGREMKSIPAGKIEESKSRSDDKKEVTIFIPSYGIKIVPLQYAKSLESENSVQNNSLDTNMCIQDKLSDTIINENNNNNKLDSLMKDETSQNISTENKATFKDETRSVTSVNKTLEANDNHVGTMSKNSDTVASQSDDLTEDKMIFEAQNSDKSKDNALISVDQTSRQEKIKDGKHDEMNVVNFAFDEGKCRSSNDDKTTEVVPGSDVIGGDKTSNDPCNHNIIATEITLSCDDRSDVLSFACKMADIPTSEDEMPDALSNHKTRDVECNDKIESMDITRSSYRAKIPKQGLKSLNKSYRCCYCLKEFQRNRTGFLLFRKHKKTHEKRYYKSWHKICYKKTELKTSELHETSQTLEGPNVADKRNAEVEIIDQGTQVSHETPKIPRKDIVSEENSILFRLLQKRTIQPERSTSSHLVSQSPVIQVDTRQRSTGAQRSVPRARHSTSPLDPYQQAHQAHLNQTSWYGQPHNMAPNQSPANPYVSFAPSHSTGVNPMTSWAAAQTAASFLANSFDPSHPMAALSPGGTWPLSHIVAYNMIANSYPHIPMPINPGNVGAPPYPTVNSNETSHPNVSQMNPSELSHPAVVNPGVDPNQPPVMNYGNNPAATNSTPFDIGASYLQHLLSFNRDVSPIPMEVNQQVSSDSATLNQVNSFLQAAINPVTTSAASNNLDQIHLHSASSSIPNANYVDCGNVIVNLDDPDASINAAAVYSAIEGNLPQTTVENPVTSAMSYSTVNPGLPSNPSYSTTMNSFIHRTQPTTTVENTVNPSVQSFARNINSVSPEGLPYHPQVTSGITTTENSAALPNSTIPSGSAVLPQSMPVIPAITTSEDAVIQQLLPQSTAVEHINNTTTVNSAIANAQPEFTPASQPKRRKPRKTPAWRKQKINPANADGFDPSNRFVCYSCQINLPDDSTWREHMLSHSVFKNHTKRGRPKNHPNQNNNNYVNL